MKKCPTKVLVVFFIVLISIGYFLWDWHKFKKTPLIPLNHSVDYVLKPGVGIKRLAFDLYHQGEIHHPYYLILLAYLEHKTTSLKAGEYEFIGGITPKQLLQQIVEGRVVIHSITFIEGWTFEQIRDALSKEIHLKHVLATMNNQTLLTRLGALSQSSPEGLLFPDTYHFTADMSDYTIVQRAYQKMQHVLAEEWPDRAPFVFYHTPYEALIVASLIEKETRLAVERPIVANVIGQRIQKGMPLQIDSTLIYGLGKHYTGTLHKEDMHRDTLYNSYLHRGLPPTPIANPGKASILAALHPWPSKVLYFVARGDGSQQFSSTFKEHQQAVAKFIHKAPAKLVVKSVSEVKPKALLLHPCPLAGVASYGIRLLCDTQH